VSHAEYDENVMAWTARNVLAPLAIGGCLGPVPPGKYDSNTDDTTMSSDPTTNTTPSTSTPSTSTSTPSTSTPSTSTPTTETETETTSDVTTTSDTTTDSSSSSTTGGPVLPHGPCSPVPTELVLTGPAGGIYTVSNEEIAVEFDAAENYTASSLTDGGGSELLLTADDPHERLIGIGYFMSPGVDEYSWRGSDAVLTVLEDGPAVVQVEVTWTTDDASTDASLVGTTVYTIIPDGRLVRQEALQFMDPTLEASYLTAYMSLDASAFDQVQASFPFVNCRGAQVCDVGDANEVAIYGYGFAELDTWMCATHEVFPHSVSWMIDSASPTGEFEVSARLSEVNEGAAAHSLAMQYDWVRGTNTQIGDYGIDVLAYVDDDDPDCACSEQHFASYGERPTPTETSGVDATNYRSQGAFYDVEVNADTFELTFGAEPLPPTMLLRIDGRSAITEVAIEGDTLTEGDDYLWQSGIQDKDSAWLYLARPLAEGETLTITATP
jgi:hypothetical protein